jgi:shikimate dehydrogenase
MPMTLNVTKGDMAGFQHGLIGGVGQPIAENPTGVMQEAAFGAMGLQWRYLLIEAGADELADVIAAMKALKFIGANFTVPHKVAVIEYLDDLAPSAKIIGAVNTVRIDADGRWIGENTDGQGFLHALMGRGIDPVGKHATILGAGGAARAISVELALAGVAEITIVNRSIQRGEALAEVLRAASPASVSFEKWQPSHIVARNTDILINATSIGLYPDTSAPDVDMGSITPGMMVCDVIPNPPQTAFLTQTAAKGAATMDGLDMIVLQGARALEMWSGCPAPAPVMRAAIDAAL